MGQVKVGQAHTTLFCYSKCRVNGLASFFSVMPRASFTCSGPGESQLQPKWPQDVPSHLIAKIVTPGCHACENTHTYCDCPPPPSTFYLPANVNIDEK